MRALGLLACAALLAWIGCSTGGANDPPAATPDAGGAATPTWHRDVAPLFADHCMTCHVGGLVGPFSLTNFDDVAPRHLAIAATVGDRRMPPWLPDDTCRPLVGSRRLNEGQIELIRRWSLAGAPLGDPSSAGPIVRRTKSTLPWVDRSVDTGVDYKPKPLPGTVDDERCFVIDPQITEDSFLVGYDFAPTYREQVLRGVLFDADLTEARAKDDADPGPGWACGETGTERIVGRWAWAFGPIALPPGSGVKLTAGRGLVLKLNYHLHEASLGALDRTKVLLQLARAPIVREAEFVLIEPPFAAIPPRSVGFTATASHALAAGGTVWGIEPRMNSMGQKFRAEIEREGGSGCLLDVPRWDYHWEELNFFEGEEGVAVAPGGTIGVRCTWDNPTDLPRPRGPGMLDEACEAAVVVTRP